MNTSTQPPSDDQPTRPSDVWICCNCVSPGEILPSTSFNLFTLVGDDCPLCSHNRCPNCDPPKHSSLTQPTTIDLPSRFLRQPTITSEADRIRFLNRFAPHYYFRPEIAWTNVTTAYTAWEWLQFYNGGRMFPRGRSKDEWTLAPLPGNWQCCTCATFNQASPEEAGNHADSQRREECIRKDHFRCRMCFTQPKEGEPMDFRPR